MAHTCGDSPDAIATASDVRGMQSLLRLLGPAAPSARAAHLLLQQREPLLLCTGFPVAGSSETDGPVGAIVLARALERLGRCISVVSWADALTSWAPVLGQLPRSALPVGEPPPRLSGTPITIEVCGRIPGGRYENMRGLDVSARAPWFEAAVGMHALVSIGDGGNEFGMGSAPASWFEGRPVRRPSSTCECLVVGQVSNWAALAIVAQLARITSRDLLPEPADYQAMLESLAAHGVVDGCTGLPTPTEDGCAALQGSRVVEQLRAWAESPMQVRLG